MKNLRSMQGEVTRDRLLNALESIVADDGVDALSHRTIAHRAQVHPGLVHYHFGTIDRALDEALARRASRLVQAQLASITRVASRPRYSVADLVAALWHPFESLARSEEAGWRNYFCLLARLLTVHDGDARLAAMFAPVMHAFRDAVARLFPAIDAATVREGFQHVFTLFEREIRLLHCGARSPVDGRLRRERMVRFAAAGFERTVDVPYLPVHASAD